MNELFLPFTVGLLGSLHCLGMCGPLVLAFSLQACQPATSSAGPPASLPTALSHHLAFHAGRLLTYGLLGALAAALFQLAAFSQVFTGLRGGMTLAGGVLMVIIGLVALGTLPAPGFLGSSRFIPAAVKDRLLPALFRSRQPWAKALLGLLAGFLPCGLSWAMVVKAAATGRPFMGFLTMLAFGLGTVPVLLAAGLFTSTLSLRLRLAGERLAALAVICMGILLIRSGVRFLA